MFRIPNACINPGLWTVPFDIWLDTVSVGVVHSAAGFRMAVTGHTILIGIRVTGHVAIHYTRIIVVDTFAFAAAPNAPLR